MPSISGAITRRPDVNGEGSTRSAGKMVREAHAILAFVSLLFLGIACSGPSAPALPVAPPPQGDVQPIGAGKELTVFAASSLTESFAELGQAFAASPGGAKVTFNFGGSNALRAQIEQGAGVDVFASADEVQMNALVESGLVTETPSIFARNRLVVITPKSAQSRIQRFQDLVSPGLKIVVAGPTVPVGSYTLQMLDKAAEDASLGARFREQFTRNVVSHEANVKQVVAKIQLGEGDVGIVYSTDVTPKVAPDIHIIDIPASFNVVASYPVAVTKNAKQRELGQAFVDYLTGTDGQAVLRKYNFISLR